MGMIASFGGLSITDEGRIGIFFRYISSGPFVPVRDGRNRAQGGAEVSRVAVVTSVPSTQRQGGPRECPAASRLSLALQ